MTLKFDGQRSKEILSSVRARARCFLSRISARGDPSRGEAAGRQRDGNEATRGVLVSRAIKNQNLWLAVGYVGLLILMARTYA